MMNSIKTKIEEDVKICDFLKKNFSSEDKFWVLAHTSDRVILTGTSPESVTSDLEGVSKENLQVLRAFNEEKELKIWGYHGKLHGRLVEDDGDKKVDQEMFLWGNDILDNPKEGKVILLEKGLGCRIEIPESFDVKKKDLPLKILVRNYYEFEHDGLLSFYDARLVKLLKRGGDLCG